MVSIRDVFAQSLPEEWRGRLWLAAAVALALVAAGDISSRLTGVGEPRQVSARLPGDRPAEPSEAASKDGAVTPALATRADAAPEKETQSTSSSEPHRRLFMLLLLNSVGSVRPYGQLGH